MGDAPPHRCVDRDLDEIMRTDPRHRSVAIDDIEELMRRMTRPARQVLEIDHVKCPKRSRRSRGHRALPHLSLTTRNGVV
jgi:hypothetical protein